VKAGDLAHWVGEGCGQQVLSAKRDSRCLAPFLGVEFRPVSDKANSRVIEPKPVILEAFVEYRLDFKDPIFRVFTLPNPLYEHVFVALKQFGVTLADITAERQPSTLRDVHLDFNIQSLRTHLKVGLEAAIFTVVKPDWSMVMALVTLFKAAVRGIRDASGAELGSQSIALAMHVALGARISVRLFLTCSILKGSRMLRCMGSRPILMIPRWFWTSQLDTTMLYL
jgi:hypothetical protein